MHCSLRRNFENKMAAPMVLRTLNECVLFSIPGRTVRADIRLDIRKITDLSVELSMQPRISVVNRAPKSVAPLSAWISSWISVLRISEREVYYGYPWLDG